MQAYVWILILVRHHQPSLLRSRQLGSPSLNQNVVMVVALKQVPRFCHIWGHTLFVPEPCPRIKKICIVVPVTQNCWLIMQCANLCQMLMTFWIVFGIHTVFWGRHPLQFPSRARSRSRRACSGTESRHWRRRSLRSKTNSMRPTRS